MHNIMNVRQLAKWYGEGKLSRHDFQRDAALFGLSATTGFSIAGLTAPTPSHAQGLPKGGALRMAMRVLDVSNPHSISFDEDDAAIRLACSNLVRTRPNNIIRPWLLEGCEVTDQVYLCQGDGR